MVMAMNGMKIPDTFYISHGSPTLSIDETMPARHFLQSFQHPPAAPRPSSILVISGHWETQYPTVNAVDGCSETIYDFCNFPKPMYQLKYPAPGAPKLAKRVKELLMSSGFKRVDEDKKRGLDHGAWVPLKLMYPEANIPVCQLSVLPDRDATYHYNMGKALAPLKEEGVLVVGSGATTHNLKIPRNTTTVQPWAQEFDTWVKEALINGRYEDVNNYMEKAPHATVAHPGTISTRYMLRWVPVARIPKPNLSIIVGVWVLFRMLRINSQCQLNCLVFLWGLFVKFIVCISCKYYVLLI